jgi:glutamate--cysteine ligase
MPAHAPGRQRNGTVTEATEVIIQEGVPTYERINDAVAEPVVTMIDRYVVGGYYRVHAERGVDENLNAPGAALCRWPLPSSHHLPRPGEARCQRAQPLLHVRRDRPPGDAGRVYELEATDPDAEVYE